MEKTDTWAAFGSEYLKAIEVVSDTDEYAIVGVESREEEGKGTVLILKLQREGVEKIFGCNKTNLYAVQQECELGPKNAIGRIITFYKVKVTNPSTKQIVDGLRLKFKPIEEPSQVNTDDSGIAEDSTI